MSQSQGILLSSSISLSLTHTTHSISPSFALSCSQTYTPSHSPGLSVCHKVMVFHYLPLSLSLSNTHTLLHTHTLNHKHTLPHTLTLSHTYTLSYFLSHSSICHKVRVFHYLLVSLSHIHTHSISPSFALSCSHTYILSHSVMVHLCVTKSGYFIISHYLSLTYTHTLSLPLLLSLTHSLLL